MAVGISRGRDGLQMRNILVIMLRYLGDVLLATPVLHALRDGAPNARITMVVNQGTGDVLKWNPDVDEVLEVTRGGLLSSIRFVGDLRRRRFDCVIDLTDGDRSAVLARATGAQVRIGFNEEHHRRGLLYTSVVTANVAGMHRIERNLEALRPVGVEPNSASLVLHTSSHDEQEADRILQVAGVHASGPAKGRPWVMVHPGARYWFKAWPPDRFAELADRLAQRPGCTVLVGGGESDGDLAQEIRARARSAPAVLAGRTSVLQFAAILKRCALFIGNDNGPMHMAAALGIPLVALFGPSDPTVWGPRGGKSEVLYKGVDCRDCYRRNCHRGEESCMRQITVDEVVEAARRCLASRSSLSPCLAP